MAHDRGWGLGGTSGMDALVGGTLTYDDGCVLLSGDVVVWPDGTSWDEEATVVRLGDGTEIHVGDSVTGGGGMAAEGRHKGSWIESENGRELAECLAPTAAVVIFNAVSDLEVSRPE